MEIVITMVSLANLQMQSCRCDDVENILMPSVGGLEVNVSSNLVVSSNLQYKMTFKVNITNLSPKKLVTN